MLLTSPSRNRSMFFHTLFNRIHKHPFNGYVILHCIVVYFGLSHCCNLTLISDFSQLEATCLFVYVCVCVCVCVALFSLHASRHGLGSIFQSAVHLVWLEQNKPVSGV